MKTFIRRTIKQPELTTDKKETTDSSIFRAKFQELSSQYPDFQLIYTQTVQNYVLKNDVHYVLVVCNPDPLGQET